MAACSCAEYAAPGLLLQRGQSDLSSAFSVGSRVQFPANWARCILVLQCMLSGSSHPMVSSIPSAADGKRPPNESRYHCSPPSSGRCLQEPCLADMESLPYTSAVLKEAMRLYPPAGVATREASSEIEVGLIF